MAGKPRGESAKRSALHFRIDDDILNDLDSLVAELKHAVPPVHTTRSALVRTILADHLGHDARIQTTKEVLSNVWYVTQFAVAQVMHDITGKLPGYVDTGFEELRGRGK